MRELAGHRDVDRDVVQALDLGRLGDRLPRLLEQLLAGGRALPTGALDHLLAAEGLVVAPRTSGHASDLTGKWWERRPWGAIVRNSYTRGRQTGRTMDQFDETTRGKVAAG
jgi:hypothetical protein